MKKQPILSSNNLTLGLLVPLLLLATLWTYFGAPLPAEAQGGDEELWRTLETPFEHVGQVLEDKEGNIWVVSWTGQVVSSREPITNEEIEQPDSNTSFTTIAGQGLAKFEQGDWTIYTSENTNGELPGNNIHAALFDQNNNLWLSVSKNKGYLHKKTVRFNGNNWKTFTISNTNGGLVDNSVRNIFEDEDGKLWFATLEGVSRYDGNNWEVIADQKTLRSGTFKLFQDSKYRLWVSIVDADTGISVLKIMVKEQPLNRLKWLVYGSTVVTFGGLIVFSAYLWRKQKATKWDIEHHFNPFISEVAVKDPQMFFGRQEVLHDVLRSIQATNFVIYGEKRIGKTSLLHQIDHRLSEMEGQHFDYLPFVVSLHAMSEERFFRDLMRKMVARIKSRGRYPAEGLSLECEQADMPYDSISFNGDLDTLQSVLDAENDLPLRMVLLVDEGDVLKRYSQDTLAQLRATFMVLAGDYLKIVLTCEGPDERAWTLDGSPWMSIFGKDYRLTPFTDEIARKLIVEPVPNYTYEEEAIERILQRSQLVPRHIQNICRQIINEILANKTGTITLDYVERALPKVDNLPTKITDEEEQE